MRKFMFLIALLAVGTIPNTALACDSCSLLSGVTPMDLKSQAGLFFRYRTFRGLENAQGAGTDGSNKTQHGPDETPVTNPDGSTADVRESFYKVTANLRWFFKERWNMQVALPFAYNFETSGDAKKSGTGLGDISMLVNYGLIVGESGRHAWRVFAGAGIKLPSGWRFRRLQDRQNYPDIQGGTGSLDFLFQTEGSWRFGNNGVTANAIFRLNTTNAEQIRYGNFFNANMNFFHQFDLQGINSKVLPFVGAYLETFSGRYESGTRVAHTGGAMLFANIGVSWFTGPYALRPQVQIPVAQDLYGIQLKNRTVVSMEASIAF